jgi:hypothetical protein
VEESLEIIRTVFNDALHTWAIELKETGFLRGGKLKMQQRLKKL